MLEQLFNNGQIWQGHKADASYFTNQYIDTGFPQLNQQLSGGGWPGQGLIEIFHRQQGIGELSLLMPCLKQLSQGSRWIVCIAPPHQLNAIALVQAGVNIAQVVVVNSTKPREILWASEEAIKSKATCAVLSWPSQIHSSQIRRLQMCAVQAQTPCFMFRCDSPIASTSALKLKIEAAASQELALEIIRQRHGWKQQPITLPVKRCPPFRYPVPHYYPVPKPKGLQGPKDLQDNE